MPGSPILVINTGSSSLKFGLYVQQDGDEQPALEGLADGIGRDKGKLELRGANGRRLRSENFKFPSQQEALSHAGGWLTEVFPEKPVAVGHRVVHGGPRLVKHQRITHEVEQELRASLHFAPLHIPMALQLIEAAKRTYPSVPQFAC